ncbi:MarR family transcriptional regulator [Streptomyces sp. NPDC051921]|uniref:MarR family winged helix-turn-helix transcriptional regulator n=1 Tax=Streptomyces sp. NPDC051921 TaxID=3155806 RepID=UPI00341F7BEB
MRMSELAVLTNGSLSRLSHVVKRLEKQGWVRRTPDPDNGRYTLAVLTETGWEKVVATAPGHVEEVRRLVFDPLAQAQQRTLRAIGSRCQPGHRPHRCLPGVTMRSPVPSARRREARGPAHALVRAPAPRDPHTARHVRDLDPVGPDGGFDRARGDPARLWTPAWKPRPRNTGPTTATWSASPGAAHAGPGRSRNEPRPGKDPAHPASSAPAPSDRSAKPPPSDSEGVRAG